MKGVSDMKKLFLFLVFCLFSLNLFAESPHSFVALNDQSEIYFKSYKNEGVEVAGNFSGFSSLLSQKDSLGKEYQANVTIFLREISSGNGERDKNIENVFFIADKNNTKANLNFTLPGTLIQGKVIKKGKVKVNGELDLMGQKTKLEFEVLSLGDNKIKNSEPIKLSIKSLGLQKQLEALMKVCGHKTVKDEVEIYFMMTWKAFKG